MSYFKPDGSIDSEAIERHRKAHPSSQEEARRITQAQQSRARLLERRKQGMHVALEIDGKPMCLFITPELMDKVADLMQQNPEKYQGGKGLLKAMLDANKD